MLTLYGFPEEVAADVAAQWAHERSTVIKTTGNAEVRTVGERRPDVLDEILAGRLRRGAHWGACSVARDDPMPASRSRRPDAVVQGLRGAGARVVLLRLPPGRHRVTTSAPRCGACPPAGPHSTTFAASSPGALLRAAA